MFLIEVEELLNVPKLEDVSMGPKTRFISDKQGRAWFTKRNELEARTGGTLRSSEYVGGVEGVLRTLYRRKGLVLDCSCNRKGIRFW